MYTSGMARARVVLTSAVMLAVIGYGVTPTPAQSAELKALSPQSDDIPLRLERPKSISETTPKSGDQTTDSPDISKLHKLEVSKQALLGEQNENREPNGEALNGNDGVLIINGQTRIINNGETRVLNPGDMQYMNGSGMHIYMQSFSINTNVNNIPIDPFLALRALFGSSKSMRKLYAERDTGYGVCGLAVNMPIGRKGYAVIQKTFPSMPAEAADLHAGDVVLTVNCKSTLDIAPAEVWDWFTGMPGTPVQLEVSRDRQPLEVTLRRMDIGRIPDFTTRATFLTIYQRNGMSRLIEN